MFKYETHLHTSEVSACSYLDAKTQVKLHYEKGYTGIVVTDHFVNGNCTVDKQLPWHARIKGFMNGYQQAFEAAKGLDFDVFFGLEYSYHGADFITYGVDEAFLLSNPDLLDWPIEQYFDMVHQAGGFIIHAHPFREAFYIPKIQLFTEYIDAVEVMNNNNSLMTYNEKAFNYAKANNLPMTKGTDLHYLKDVGALNMTFDKRAKSIFDLIEMIKTSRFDTL